MRRFDGFDLAMIHRRSSGAGPFGVVLAIMLLMFASNPRSANAQTCASGSGQLTGSLNGVNPDTHSITLLPCQTLSVGLVGTTGGSGSWAQVAVRVEIWTASNHVLYARDLVCGLSCTATLPHSTAANGAPLPGTRGVEGLAAKVYIHATNFNWGAAPPFDYVMTVTKTGRDGYNQGGIGLCDAPEIGVEVAQYGSVYPQEPGQYYKIHLLQDQLIYATGTATASAWGSNFRIWVLNSSGTWVATIGNVAAYGVTPFPSVGNNPLTYTNTGAAADFYLQITSVSSMTTDFNFQVRTPRLTVSPNPVTRGQTATFTVVGALGGTMSSWRYDPTSYSQVSRITNTGSATWSGTVVVGGTGRVTVTMAGRNIPLLATLSVSARSGWASTAGGTSKQNWGFVTPGGGFTLAPDDPPTVSSTEKGAMYGLDLMTLFNTIQIGDNGPNHGFHYVTSIVDSNTYGPTKFYWVVIPSLENAQSTFFQKQCGNYHAINNPAGYISGGVLLANVTRHEVGATSSHYQQYLAAQNAPANNLGTYAESAVGAPGKTIPEFVTDVNGALDSRKQTILNLTSSPEPFAVNYDAAGVWMGYINLSPYDPNAGC